MKNLLIATLALAAAACGEAASFCNASTCSGCCTADDQCVPATGPSACGLQGQLCVACGAGRVCQLGACVPASGWLPPEDAGANGGEERDAGLVLDAGEPDAGREDSGTHDAGVPHATLAVATAGTGAGRVFWDGYESAPFCPQTCARTAPAGWSARLLPEEDEYSGFTSWVGPCSSGVGRSCTVTADQDVTVTAHFQRHPLSPAPSRTRLFHPASVNGAPLVRLGPSGELFLMGKAGGALDLGGGTLPSGTYFLARFDAAGAHQWSVSLALPSSTQLGAFVVDPAGSVWLGGLCEASTNFGGGALGAKGACLARFDAASGAHQASLVFPSTSAKFTHLAISPSGALGFAGVVGATSLTLGGVTLGARGRTDFFVGELSSAGAVTWAKRGAGGDDDESGGLAYDGAGTLHFTAWMRGGGSFETLSVSAPNFGWGALWARFGEGGTFLGGRDFDTTNVVSFEALAANASGRVVLAGRFNGTVDFGGGALTAGNGVIGERVLAAYESDGRLVWLRRFYSGELDEVVVAADGSVLLGGDFFAYAELGGGYLNGDAYVSHCFAARFDAQGQHLWSKALADGCGAVSVALGSGAHAAGAFNRRLRVGSRTPVSASSLFLLSFPP